MDSPAVCPYRYQGVLASTIISSMKPRARSGASARSEAWAGPRSGGAVISVMLKTLRSGEPPGPLAVAVPAAGLPYGGGQLSRGTGQRGQRRPHLIGGEPPGQRDVRAPPAVAELAMRVRLTELGHLLLEIDQGGRRPAPAGPARTRRGAVRRASGCRSPPRDPARGTVPAARRRSRPRRSPRPTASGAERGAGWARSGARWAARRRPVDPIAPGSRRPPPRPAATPPTASWSHRLGRASGSRTRCCLDDRANRTTLFRPMSE